MAEGRIIRATAGFYYADTGSAVVECKARGALRMGSESPMAGDIVIFTPNGDKGVLEKILPRKNALVRPPVANVDRVFIVSSMSLPAPNTLLIDRELAVCAEKGIEPIVVFNKSDDGDAERLKKIYGDAGYTAVVTSCKDGFGIEELKSYIADGVNVFTGNSGVGKSSLLNLILPDETLKTGEVSLKLGRGRHTTRTTELYKLDGKYIADTAGFSSFDLESCETVTVTELPYTFREFGEYADKCRFTDCSHTCEKGCAVIEAVKEGKIDAGRHRNYCIIYDSIKDIDKWKFKKK